MVQNILLEKMRRYTPRILINTQLNPSGIQLIKLDGKLTLHHHAPDEIYVVTNGSATLNKDGELEEIKKGDVVYISNNAKHALKNNTSETFGFYWLFPTDLFKEVEYFSDE